MGMGIGDWGLGIGDWGWMHMEMEYRLSGCLSVILNQIEAVRMQSLIESGTDFLRHTCCLPENIFRNLKQIRIVILGKDQCMSLCCRIQIKDYAELVILVECGRRDLPICDLTENAVIVFHFQLPPYVHLSIFIYIARTILFFG